MSTTVSNNPTLSSVYTGTKGVTGYGTNINEARQDYLNKVAQLQLGNEPNSVNTGDVRTSEDKPE